MSVTFSQEGLLNALEAMDSAELDDLPFGVVGMAVDGTVINYNAGESSLSGLSATQTVGRHFFSAVAPCTNNFMVAHRFETEAVIDDIIEYVFTMGMRPTKVRIRLLKDPSCTRMFLAAEPV